MAKESDSRRVSHEYPLTRKQWRWEDAATSAPLPLEGACLPPEGRARVGVRGRAPSFKRLVAEWLPPLLLLVFGLSGCGPRESVFHGSSMGTAYMVKIVSEKSLSQDRQEECREAVQTSLDRIESLMSTYREDSELSRFNQTTSTDAFPLSPETLEVFRLARQISELSGGAFDVTVGPLVNAWGFGPEEWIGGPDPETLAKLMERVGYNHLILEEEGIRKTRPDLYCDLAAIAKGYGADQAARSLDRLGIENYLVEVGGEICTKGYNRQGEPWSVAIEKPNPAGRSIFRIVHLSGEAIATSGDYRNFREVDGVRLSHTIDPKTGRPVAHSLASASVIDRQCARADAFATALMVLGPEKGPELARRERLAAFFVLHDGNNGFTSLSTPEMEKYLSKNLDGD